VSRRKLAILSAVSILAAVLAWILGPRHDEQLDRERVFTTARAQPLQGVEVRAGDSLLIAVERAARGYRILAPEAVPARVGALDSFAGALWTTEVVRAVDVSEIPGPRVTVRAHWPEGELVFELAEPEDEANVGHVVVGGRGFIIPGHAARDLWLTFGRVRARQPLAELDYGGGPVRVSVRGEELLRIESGPWRLWHPSLAGEMLVAPDAARALLSDLARVGYREFHEVPVGVEWRLLRSPGVGGGTLELRFADGCTSGGIRVSGHLGAGCASGLETLRAALDEPMVLVDRNLVTAGRDGEVSALTITGAGRQVELRVEEDWSLAGKPIEPERVASVLRDLDGAVGGDPESLPKELPRAALRVSVEVARAKPLQLTYYRRGGRYWVRRGPEPAWWPVNGDPRALVGPLFGARDE